MTTPFSSPVNLSPGVWRDAQGQASWQLWAPRCDRVGLVTWPDGQLDEVPMQPAGDGFFTHRASHVEPGLRYAFRLPGGQTRPDPASRWQPAGVHEPSAVFFPAEFAWSDHAWRGVPLASLVIYELHVGTFTPDGTFDAVIQRLPELVELGVTAIELMPVSQFPGDRNWGYDGVHPFAVQETYGGPQGLQRLVDAAHGVGLGVLLDVVYNHFGPEGNYFSEFGPYYNDRHHTPWGPAINFDGPDSDPVRRFVVENALYWIRDFHLDGLRLDAVQTMVDDGAQHILQEIQSAVREVASSQQRHIHVIGETNQNDSRLTDPVSAGGYALDGVWADDLHHSLHALLTGESDGYYADFGCVQHLAKAWERGWAYDGCYSRFRRRRHGNSTANTPKTRFIVGLQNHDQVGNRFDSARIASLVTAPQQRLAAAVVLLSPFTPLLFMGEEYGETAPFPFFCSFLDRSLNRAVGRGRKRDFAAAGFRPRDGAQPAHSRKTFQSAVLSWQWRDDRQRDGLRQMYRSLLTARQVWPPLQQHWPASCSLAESGLLTVTYGPPDVQPPAANAATDRQFGLQVLINFGDQPCQWNPELQATNRTMLFGTELTVYGGCRHPDDTDSPLVPFELVVVGDAGWALPGAASNGPD